MNAQKLGKLWIWTKKTEDPEWSKIFGIMKNLLAKHKSTDIADAITIFCFYYPTWGIVRFASYCERIIKNEKNKRRARKRARRKN